MAIDNHPDTVNSILRNFRQEYPGHYEQLAGQIAGQDKNLLGNAGADLRGMLTESIIRDAVANLVDEGFNFAQLGDLSPQAAISNELDKMSARVASGHSARVKSTPRGSQER